MRRKKKPSVLESFQLVFSKQLSIPGKEKALWFLTSPGSQLMGIFHAQTVPSSLTWTSSLFREIQSYLGKRKPGALIHLLSG